MADKAILVYGFDETDAFHIKNTIESILPCDIDLFSATGCELKTVEQCLEGTDPPIFSAQAVRFMMFLGFDDSEISNCLSAFPEKIARPIFCALTENNYRWTISYLSEHLQQEHREMTGKTAKQ